MAPSPPLQQVDRTFVRVGRRRLVYFGGCDYYRLASHPAVLKAFHEGAEQYGINVAASRRTTGNHRIYGQLERRAAGFFKREAVLLAPNGYLTNLAVAQACSGRFSQVFIDELAHAALVDASRFFDCPVARFKHRDPEDLQRALRQAGRGLKPVVLTDGMFAHDGSVAPLKEYLDLLPGGAMLLVDDAHGAGVLGKNGRGTPEHAGVEKDPRVVQTGTLSKAFGAYGGVILGSRGSVQAVMEKSRVFTGSTPLPLPMACAALAALEIVRTDCEMRRRLERNARLVRGKLREAGWELADSPGPVMAIIPNDAREADAIRKRLLKANIFPPLIRYPGGPENGYFRFAVSSEHSPDQLEALAEALCVS